MAERDGRGGAFPSVDVVAKNNPELFRPMLMESTTKPGMPIDPASMPAGKTPVSLLTEICARRNITVIPQLVGDGGGEGGGMEGGGIEGGGGGKAPAFTFLYEVDGLKAIGRGKNKKFAKHLAAKRILEQIIYKGNFVEWAIPGRTKQEAQDYLNSLLPELNDVAVTAAAVVSADGSVDGNDDALPDTAALQLDNPVGKVNEKCLRMKLPGAIWDVVEEKGQPNDKTFVIACRIGNNFETRGEGRNKKVAKRNAAIEMLKVMDTLTPADALLGKGMDDALGALTEEDSAAAAAGNSACDASASTTSVVSNGHAKSSRNERLLKHLEKMPMQATRECRSQLQKALTDVLGVSEPQFHPSEPPDANGQYQCLVQLAVNPVAVCHGTGDTRELAEYSAAHNALQYLKLMAKSDD